MPLEIVLLVPRRRFIANRFGIGYQVPLGMVFLGGPLIDAGHRVRLIDNDALGWSLDRLVKEIALRPPDCVFLGHTGSTAAHPAAMETARAIRRRLPFTRILYGGPYPSSAAALILEENPAVDAVVRGEGEETVLELVAAIHEGRPAWDSILGITWRDRVQIRRNADRPPAGDLDRFRPGWELVDWDRYRLFGFGRSAGMQFSRGCPLRCGYCGQWSFWRRWRHRSPASFAGELERLARRHRVRIVWLADENFAADRDLAREVLQALIERDLGLSINLNMTAADVVRDADLLHLYKRAGVDNIVLGVESLEDDVVRGIGKTNPFAVSREAVRLLRSQGIVSLVNVIYGLVDESPETLLRTFRRLRDLDPDVLNAVYLTPHSWTATGRATDPSGVIQPDLSRFTYRNQVLHSPRLAPLRLFLGVKATELLFHLRPQSIARCFTGPDGRYRKILRAYLTAGARVFLAEVFEFIFRTRFVAPGSLERIPGYPGTREKAGGRASPRPLASLR